MSVTVPIATKPVLLCGHCGSQSVQISGKLIRCELCRTELGEMSESEIALSERAINLRPLLNCNRITMARTGARVMYVWNNQPIRLEDKAHKQDEEPLHVESDGHDAKALLEQHKQSVAKIVARCQAECDRIVELGGRVTLTIRPLVDSAYDVRLVIEAHTHEPSDRKSREVVFRTSKRCPRCSQRHEYLAFWKYSNPVAVSTTASVTHFGTCPNTGEPINLVTGKGSDKSERIV